MKNRRTYPVEPGVTPPPEYAERIYYPWNEVEIGGSFFIPKESPIAVRSCRQNVYAANRRFEAKGLPNKYRAWREFEQATNAFRGMRIQRVE